MTLNRQIRKHYFMQQNKRNVSAENNVPRAIFSPRNVHC